MPSCMPRRAAIRRQAARSILVCRMCCASALPAAMTTGAGAPLVTRAWAIGIPCWKLYATGRGYDARPRPGQRSIGCFVVRLGVEQLQLRADAELKVEVLGRHRLLEPLGVHAVDFTRGHQLRQGVVDQFLELRVVLAH